MCDTCPEVLVHHLCLHVQAHAHLPCEDAVLLEWLGIIVLGESIPTVRFVSTEKAYRHMS